MNGQVIQALIMKDLRLHRTHVLASLAAGGLAIAILLQRNETAFMLGTVWFFVSLIVLGCLLPVSNVINERKKQTAVFLMSLPLSPLQYGISKMVSTVSLFLVPWMALVIAGSTLMVSRSDVPNGVIPFIVILVCLPLVGFIVMAAAALVSESEGWTIAATVVCNSSYGLASYFLMREPAIRNNLRSPVPVWNQLVLTVLGGELAAIVLILALTLYLQSRKREFV